MGAFTHWCVYPSCDGQDSNLRIMALTPCAHATELPSPPGLVCTGVIIWLCVLVVPVMADWSRVWGCVALLSAFVIVDKRSTRSADLHWSQFFDLGSYPSYSSRYLQLLIAMIAFIGCT